MEAEVSARTKEARRRFLCASIPGVASTVSAVGSTWKFPANKLGERRIGEFRFVADLISTNQASFRGAFGRNGHAQVFSLLSATRTLRQMV